MVLYSVYIGGKADHLYIHAIRRNLLGNCNK
jgi:hypothetical protein